MERIKRIQAMEEKLDAVTTAVKRLSAALEEYENVQLAARELKDYYLGGAWMSDYEADERGELPQNLKRGVLSEDAVYNLLSDQDCLLERMAELCAAQEGERNKE